MPGPGFVHLHIHSAYSLLEGALKLGTLHELAKADKQPAIGIADTNNLFGALEFSEKAAGGRIQPLLARARRRLRRYRAGQGLERNNFGKSSIVLMAGNEDGFIICPGW